MRSPCGCRDQHCVCHAWLTLLHACLQIEVFSKVTATSDKYYIAGLGFVGMVAAAVAVFVPSPALLSFGTQEAADALGEAWQALGARVLGPDDARVSGG